MNQMQRKKLKRPSKEALLLRKMRIEHKISTLKMAKAIGVSQTWLVHLETGRFDATDQDLAKVSAHFKVSLEELKRLASELSGDQLICLKDECTTIIRRLPDDKLRAVYALLTCY